MSSIDTSPRTHPLTLTRIGFALEYSLGHATHAENLKAALHSHAAGRFAPLFADIDYHATLKTRWGSLPGVRANWSLRASLGAYRALAPHVGRGRVDVLLFHTQVTALLSTGLMRRVPSVISLDATPKQIDALGASYGHQPSGNARVEAAKAHLNRRAFAAARRLVTWSEWAKASLVADYGVPVEKVTVIPPGVDTARWGSLAPRDSEGSIRLLFVGGDFARKGGATLLTAFERLSSLLPAHLRGRVRLDIVTRSADAGDGVAGVRVHRGLVPNAPALQELFSQVEVFVFPTEGDCLPLAVMEAMAAGLPVVTTQVGALAELIRDGETGLIVRPRDPDALAAALARLVADASLRRRLSREVQEAARSRFDAARNYRKLLVLLSDVAAGG